MGICLQQMGHIRYCLGGYPKALEYHLKADKIFREENKPELIAGNLDDMGIVYYYNRQIPVARKQYSEAQAIDTKINNVELGGNIFFLSFRFLIIRRITTAAARMTTIAKTPELTFCI